MEEIRVMSVNMFHIHYVKSAVTAKRKKPMDQFDYVNWKEFGTGWILEQWGLWARTERFNHLSYPSKTNFAKYQGQGIKAASIKDDTGLILDRAVKCSSKVDTDFETALFRVHLMKYNYSQLARFMHVDRRKATEIVLQAERFVDGYLHSLIDTLEQ